MDALLAHVSIYMTIFLNEPRRRVANYIKKKEQRPDWAQQTTINTDKDDISRLDWDINTATQLHSNST
jgi:hypothetical protein